MSGFSLPKTSSVIPMLTDLASHLIDVHPASAFRVHLLLAYVQHLSLGHGELDELDELGALGSEITVNFHQVYF